MNESTAQANGHQPIERLVDVDLIARVEFLERRLSRIVESDHVQRPVWVQRTGAVMGWIAVLSMWLVTVLALVGVLR